MMRTCVKCSREGQLLYRDRPYCVPHWREVADYYVAPQNR